MTARPLVCFDIDGTLLRTRGAGREALDEAFLAVCGWASATDGVHIAGSTDGAIVRDVAAARGEVLDAGRVEAVRRVYLDALARRLADPERTTRCPGVCELLDALAPVAHVALLTGNWADGARIKLRAAGLVDAFAWGVYADDAVERDHLVPVARARAGERGLAVAQVFVVGDTVNDIRCARAGAAVAVAVETGFSTPEALAAERADLQLADLARGAPWLLAAVYGSSGS